MDLCLVELSHERTTDTKDGTKVIRVPSFRFLLGGSTS
ncbi:hypothetical protein PLANPX_0308 [Lacipirellula parvula]|uniref:Uncharacterized protein n=1 Tax=Lacipirellula parvula TaxID=2650471 RepID=A0A5K7X8S2_9BACT|nr:hypothetical protein PLANPX_0308 [Lacipirellula parvula]